MASTSASTFLGIAPLAAAIRGGEISSVAVVTDCLQRIERDNAAVNAFVHVAADQALAAAHDSDRRVHEGTARVLEGVPIAIKDDTVVAGMPISDGTAMVPDTTLDIDAHLVALLRDAGAVIVGKTNLPEFGTIAVTEGGRWGDCRNPWDLTRTPGGSSGGSAAAVAAGMVPAAHGCDGGGSLRIPASCCGLFTMKPTRGRVSTSPYASESPLTVHGFLTRSVVDNALLLDITQGQMPGDPFMAPPATQPYVEAVASAHRAPRLRIAVTMRSPFELPVDPACARALQQAADLCRSLGHEVDEVTPDWCAPTHHDDFMDIWSVAIGWYVALLVERGADLAAADPHNRAIYERSQGIRATAHVRLWNRWRDTVRRILATWETYDVVLTPTLAQLPLRIGELFSDAERPISVLEKAFAFTPFTPIVNVTGQPAAQLPLFEHDGLPVGIQAIGRFGDEATLFQLSAQLEAAQPWAHRRPAPFSR